MPTKYDGEPTKFPTKPEIHASVLNKDFKADVYDGPIEPGMIFAWEPFLPWARELVVVGYVNLETKLVTTFSEPPPTGKYENHRVNNIDKFRKAVVPTIYRYPSIGSTFTRTLLQYNLSQPEENKAEPVFDLHTLAKDVADVWTDDQFNNASLPHRHFTHALIHVFKACGKLCDHVDMLDHGNRYKEDKDPTSKALADIIISTQRMAQKSGVDLAQAVSDRLDTLRIRHSKPGKTPIDAQYEASARIMFEEIHGITDEYSWERQPDVTKNQWREYAKNHFLRTTKINVDKASYEGVEGSLIITSSSPPQDQYSIRLVPRRD